MPVSRKRAFTSKLLPEKDMLVADMVKRLVFTHSSGSLVWVASCIWCVALIGSDMQASRMSPVFSF